MPLARRSSATWPFTDCDRMVEAAATAALAAAAADVGHRLGLGQRDLALGGLGPPGDEIFHLGLGFGRDALGLGLGAVDDILGLALGAGATGLVFGEQLGSLVLEPAGVVEFGLDAVRR